MCASASTSSCELTGLLRCAFMPASRESLRSSAKALALTAIIGVVAASSRSSARIRRVASRPSMPGIMMSINTTSYSYGALAANISTADSPSLACVTTAPARLSVNCAISAFRSLSSTSKTRRPWSASPSPASTRTARGISERSHFSNGRRMVNVVPCPKTLVNSWFRP